MPVANSMLMSTAHGIGDGDMLRGFRANNCPASTFHQQSNCITLTLRCGPAKPAHPNVLVSQVRSWRILFEPLSPAIASDRRVLRASRCNA